MSEKISLDSSVFFRYRHNRDCHLPMSSMHMTVTNDEIIDRKMIKAV